MTIAFDNGGKLSKLDIHDVLKKYKIRIKPTSKLLKTAVKDTYISSKEIRNNIRDIGDDITYRFSANPDLILKVTIMMIRYLSMAVTDPNSSNRRVVDLRTMDYYE